jgi:hypothetical protein
LPYKTIDPKTFVEKLNAYNLPNGFPLQDLTNQARNYEDMDDMKLRLTYDQDNNTLRKVQVVNMHATHIAPLTLWPKELIGKHRQ